jgi:hypothetical protein
MGVTAALCLSTLLVIMFEYGTHHLPWRWLMDHPNSLGLQGCISAIFAFGAFALCVPQWRKALLITGILRIIGVVLQILGR